MVRRELPDLLRRLEVDSILDAACGDFNWMQHVELDRVRYIGVDVVPQVIASNRLKYGREGREFIVLDVTSDELPHTDLILCRHCWIHWSFSSIKSCIANFKRSGARYLLATTSSDVQKNRDILTGQWRLLNLERSPFHFPRPLWRMREDMGNADLALWSIDQLPQ
jgi:SAM-dependent methyltransferase